MKQPNIPDDSHLVTIILNRYFHKDALPIGIELCDLWQEGYIAYMRCCETFSEDFGVKFPSYASIRIKGAMSDYIRNNKREKRSQDLMVYDVPIDSIEIIDEQNDVFSDRLSLELYQNCMESLQDTPRVLQYFEYRVRDELKNVEISDAMGITAGAVCDLSKRAQVKLKETLS